ncbi:hypothetical protein EV199_2873 [Pseudobacter ginsenosidimutans]|uniref:Uncharacterized protein n=1 Tax=Pseudobacter ginsenosidimutans TaxID=661488 RepID=A0A4Q7MSR3_9BACT|nr:hypothetical protein EV199_2873 [Pseudobacter ginsenosidimutans]
MYTWTDEERANYQRMMDLAVSLRQRKLTREEALQDLVDAGIFDENGNYTEPYKILEQYSASK